MANFQLATGSQKELFSEKYALEYTRISRFLPYTGANPEAVITTGYEVVGRATKNLHVPYFRALHEPAVYNTGLLEGKEEAQDNYNFCNASSRRNSPAPRTCSPTLKPTRRIRRGSRTRGCGRSRSRCLRSWPGRLMGLKPWTPLWRGGRSVNGAIRRSPPRSCASRTRSNTLSGSIAGTSFLRRRGMFQTPWPPSGRLPRSMG